MMSEKSFDYDPFEDDNIFDQYELEPWQSPADASQEEHRERDWRDVEKYREMRELQRELEDGYWLDIEPPSNEHFA
jgi:hypothetical protein